MQLPIPIVCLYLNIGTYSDPYTSNPSFNYSQYLHVYVYVRIQDVTHTSSVTTHTYSNNTTIS